MINDRKLRTRTTRLLMALPIAAVAFSLAACGGPAERPSVDEVSSGLQKFFDEQGQADTLSDAAATCLAEALVESDLSNETLSYLADGEDRQKDEADKAVTTQVLQDNLQECTAK